jgi:lipopolysaccharide heptosyltransferase II
MNILQILPELNVGGVESGTLDLAKSLVELGHGSVVVSNGGELVNELVNSGAKHYQLPVNKKSLVSVIKLIPRVAEIIKQEKIDIVHARSRVPAWIGYFAARRTNAVFVTSCHGYYSKHFFSRAMGWGKRVIVVSNAIARRMIDDFGVPRERISLIPRGTDLNKFAYRKPDTRRKKELNVGIIGRMTPIKGHLYFVRAMARVARSVQNLKVWIVGDAPASRQAYKEEIQVLVRRLGLWHCTEFLGTQRDVPAILSNLDVLIVATITHEAFGRIVIEAQAAGVPVVATEVGGIVDIVENEKTGLLVPPADPQSMADAVIRIYKDPQFALQLAENAHKKVKEKYSLGLMVKNTLDAYRDALSKFNILIIKLSSLGDVILSTASIRAIREKFKDNYKLSVLVSEESKDVFLNCPYIDELLIADFKNKDKGLKGMLNLSKLLMSRNFDIVIDLQNNRRSHILSFLTFSLKRYGYDNKKFGFLLNNRVREDKALIDPVAHQFRVLKLLGIESGNPRLELWPSRQDESYIEDLLSAQWLSAGQKLIGINIGASSRWATKSWPLAHIARLCEELERRDIRAVITGTKDDIEKVNELKAHIKKAKIIDSVAKTSINQLACIIKKCSVYISVDSSPLHIAAAVNTPFIALFGPTDYRRHLPPAKNFAVITKSLSCGPCYKPECKSKRCMELISVEEVLEAIDKLI